MEIRASNSFFDAISPCFSLSEETEERINKVLRSVVAGVCLGSLGGALLGAVGVAGVVGALTGVVHGFVSPLDERIASLKQRVLTLNNMAERISDNRVLKAIASVKQVFERRKLRFKQAFQHHSLHNDLTIITDEAAKRADLKRIWHVFLRKIDQLPLAYTDGTHLKLDVSLEKARLERSRPEVHIDMTGPRNPRFARDLKEIEALQKECFGSSDLDGPERFKELLARPGNGCLVVRKKETGEVLGHLFWVKEVDAEGRIKLHICQLGRKAGAAQLQIGEKLFKEFFALRICRYSTQFLEVRKSNTAAIALYEKMGFKQTGERLWFYNAPCENSLTMTRSH